MPLALSLAALILSNQEGRHAFPWALEGTSGMSEEPELPTRPWGRQAGASDKATD